MALVRYIKALSSKVHTIILLTSFLIPQGCALKTLLVNTSRALPENQLSDASDHCTAPPRRYADLGDFGALLEEESTCLPVTDRIVKERAD